MSDKDFRSIYEQNLGRKIRAGQWYKVFDKVISEEKIPVDFTLIRDIAKIKKVCERWNINVEDVLRYRNYVKEIPEEGMQGLEVFRLCKKATNGNCTQRTIRNWFYQEIKYCVKADYYSFEICENILIRAVASKPFAGVPSAPKLEVA